MFCRLIVLVFSLICVLYFGTFRMMLTFLIVPVLWIAWSVFLNRRPLTRLEFQWTSICCLFFFYIPFIAFYVYVGTYASPEPWGILNTNVSPVGRSPCCANTATQCENTPYNPNGYFSYSWQLPKMLAGDFVTFCPVGPWADSNNLAVVKYNRQPGFDENVIGSKCADGATECDNLASQRKEDYPNLAIGLTGGWIPGRTATPTSLCPGVALQANSKGFVGRGMEICARCMINPPAHCKSAAGANLACWLCPGGFFESEPQIMHYRELRFFVSLLVGQFLLMLLGTCLAVIGFRRDRALRNYNDLF